MSMLPVQEVVELQLDVQVVPTGRACLELVWEAGAVAAQSRKGSLIKLTCCLQYVCILQIRLRFMLEFRLN